MSFTRILDLAGACNLRDFGGYAGAGGRSVRRGRLFRSGLLSRLAPASVATLVSHDVRAVCDLRRTDERERHPNPSFGESARQFAWDAHLETSPIRDERFAQSPTAADARAAMVRMYERLPVVLQPRLAGTFAALEHAGEGAVLVHCTAGKDRTGIAVALIHDALGVDREAIVEDYVLTNEAVDLAEQLFRKDATGAGLAPSAATILALPPIAQAAVLAAAPEYIRASFHAIEAAHGSVARYLRDALGVDDAAVARLRERLLH